MKKNVIASIVLAVCLVGALLTGCNKTSRIETPEESIPFLALTHGRAGSVDAQLSFWDLKNGTVVSTGKTIYSAASDSAADSSTSEYAPLYWDGKDSIILRENFIISAPQYEHAEVVSPEGMMVFGDKIEILRIPTSDKQVYTYTAKLWNGEKYIERELDLQNAELGTAYPIAVDNTDSELHVLVCGSFNPQLGIELFLCTVDKGNWTSTWSRVTFTGGAAASPGNPPFPFNSIAFDGDFYIPSGCCNIAVVSTQDLVCRLDSRLAELKGNLLPPPSQNEVSARPTSILGSYDDILVVRYDILAEENPEQYMCALKNGEELLSIMHIQGANVEIMDKQGGTLSKTTLDPGSSLVFPNANGGR